MKRRVTLFLRGAVPLACVVVALVALPTLAVWWLFGGPFGWQQLLAGLLVGASLLGLGGLALGWALGRWRGGL
ncbi:MAG: hypothetical protein WCP31_06745 [Chloroflexales bacterium]